MKQYLFPCALIVLNLGAAVVYGTQGDIRKIIYYVAAAVLNMAVAF